MVFIYASKEGEMLTAVLISITGEQIPFFNGDEKIFDLQIIPYGWVLIKI